MNLSIRQLKMFVVLATTLNYSKASKELFMSQSTLSRAIQDIETQLSTMLFTRTTHTIALTENGRRFLPHAQELIKGFHNAIDAVSSSDNKLTGNIKMIASSSFVSSILPKIMRMFISQHPLARLTVIDDSSKVINTKVMNGEVDFGVGSIFGDSQGLNYRKIISTPIGIATNPLLFPVANPINIAALAKYPFLRETNDSNVTQVLRISGSDLTNLMDGGFEVSSLGTQLSMIKAGVGISVMSALGASHPFFSGLEFIPIMPAVTCDFFIISNKKIPLSPIAKALIEIIIQSLPIANFHPLVEVYK